MGRNGKRRAIISFCFSLLETIAWAVDPIVVEPSQYWEGVDGPWSTFSLRLGTPEQVVRVHVSTAWPNSVAVLSSACPGGLQSICATSRGELFAPNASSTWQERGIFSLYQELNYSMTQDTAYFGLDSVGLGLESSETKLENQVLAAMDTDDYYIGYFGIDPQPTNWTANFTVQSPSFFKSLQTHDLIPSLTYSYTAGAQYRFKEVLGSLVFGGYDASRVSTNDVTFQFADDVSRDLVVAIQSIQSTTADGSPHDLLVGGSVLAFVDSTLPYFVLPYAACVEFEQAFGLEWDPTAGDGGMYTLTDAQYSSLLSMDPNITFTLSNDLTGGPTVEITLPYAAFDLEADPPLVNASTKYFPLLRAANDTQITLGRAFLQEAMLVTDYERGNFSIWPCAWHEDAQQDIVTLKSVNSSSNSSTTASTSSQQQQMESSRLGLGIGLGVGLPILFVLAWMAFARYTRRWPFHRLRPSPPSLLLPPSNPELDSTAKPAEADGTHHRFSTSKRLIGVHEAEAGRGLGARPELAGTAYGIMASKAELEAHFPPPPDRSPSESIPPTISSLSPTSPTISKSELSAGPLPPPRVYTGTSGATLGNHELPASESQLGRSSGGSRMLMELVGSPVPSTYLKSRSPGRTPPRSPHGPRERDKEKEELPPLPLGARELEAELDLKRRSAPGSRSQSQQISSPTRVEERRSRGEERPLDSATAQGHGSPRNEMPTIRVPGRASRKVIDGGYF